MESSIIFRFTGCTGVNNKVFFCDFFIVQIYAFFLRNPQKNLFFHPNQLIQIGFLENNSSIIWSFTSSLKGIYQIASYFSQTRVFNTSIIRQESFTNDFIHHTEIKVTDQLSSIDGVGFS